MGIHSSFMSQVETKLNKVVNVFQSSHDTKKEETLHTRISSDRRRKIISSAARVVDKYNKNIHVGRNGKDNAASRIANSLEKIVLNSRGRKHSEHSLVSDDIAGLIAKNFALDTAHKDNPQPTESAGSNLKLGEEIVEYLPGVALYFGGFISLQANHGGFLSYQDPQKIKASGHRILPHTKFLILNSDDLTDNGVVKYGDAIWLQAGQYEVLKCISFSFIS